MLAHTTDGDRGSFKTSYYNVFYRDIDYTKHYLTLNYSFSAILRFTPNFTC
jgi:hypothetical protein